MQCLVCNSKQISSLRNYEQHFLARCGKCQFTFVQRIPESSELEAFYSKYAYSSDPWISPITMQRYNALLDSFEPFRKNNRIIDVGCGAGHFLALALTRGWEVYGSEFSPAALDLCRKKGIIMVEGSIANPSLQPDGFGALHGSFDVVTSFEVIEHINNPQEDLTAIVKLMRPGGLHYCTTPNFNALGRIWLKADYNVIGYPEHLSYYTVSTLHRLFTQHKLRRLSLVTEGISITRIKKSRGSVNTIKIGAANAPDEKLRERTENHFFWRFVKRAINFIFRSTRTGATLKARYIKPQ
jgi:2-polyprenyl-3-methyl-5-hydroxy-6-metoxy-1,4-benzoquinol methylase